MDNGTMYSDMNKNNEESTECKNEGMSIQHYRSHLGINFIPKLCNTSCVFPLHMVMTHFIIW